METKFIPNSPTKNTFFDDKENKEILEDLNEEIKGKTETK